MAKPRPKVGSDPNNELYEDDTSSTHEEIEDEQEQLLLRDDVDEVREEVDEDVYEREEEEVAVMERHRPPRIPTRNTPAPQLRGNKKGHVTTAAAPPPHHEEGEEDESNNIDLSIDMKSTLSDAEFLSVESSITTDQEAFNYKPGVLKRTASLVKNPALALRRVNRSSSNKDKDATAVAVAKKKSIKRKMKHGRDVARADNRKVEDVVSADNEHYFDDDNNDQKQQQQQQQHNMKKNRRKKLQQKKADDDITEVKSEEMDQVQQLLAKDETIDVNDGAIHNMDTIEESVDIEVHNENGKADIACGSNSMMAFNDNDLLLETTERFEAFEMRHEEEEEHQQAVRFQTGIMSIDSSTKMRMQEHLNPHHPPPPVTEIPIPAPIEIIDRTISKEIATQTSDDQFVVEVEMPPPMVSIAPTSPSNFTVSNNKNSDVGSFGRLMESVGLFGAQVCMGSSKFMLNCADSCSDNTPEGSVKAAQRLSEIDSGVVNRLSPSNTGGEVHGYKTLLANNNSKDPEEEAAGVLTRAIAKALQSTMGTGGVGGGGGDDQSRSVMSKQQQLRDHQSYDPLESHRHRQGINEPTDNRKNKYTDYESIDGRFVPVNRHHRRTKRVPRNIALKPRHHNHQHQHSEDIQQQHHLDETTAEVLDTHAEGTEYNTADDIDLTQLHGMKQMSSGGVGNKTKKGGISGFFKKMSKVRLGVMYEV